MANELDPLAARTPAYVVETLKAFRNKYDLLHLENPEGLFYELRAKGQDETIIYLTDASGQIDRDKYELAVVAVMIHLRQNVIK